MNPWELGINRRIIYRRERARGFFNSKFELDPFRDIHYWFFRPSRRRSLYHHNYYIHIYNIIFIIYDVSLSINTMPNTTSVILYDYYFVCPILNARWYKYIYLYIPYVTRSIIRNVK